MARSILALALCFTMSAPFVWSRRISTDNTVASALVADQGGMEHNPTLSAIFVNGFEHGTAEDALKKHFGVVGRISDVRFQSKSSAVITYEKSSAAAKAVEKLQETTLKGQTRYVTVKLDDQGSRAGAAAKKIIEQIPVPAGTASGRAVVVSGFDWATDGAALEKHFGKVGAIESLYFQSKVAAVITFVGAASAKRAVTQLDGTTMVGQTRYVAVKMDDPLYTGPRTVRK